MITETNAITGELIKVGGGFPWYFWLVLSAIAALIGWKIVEKKK
jgi:hypothetical protein